MKYRLPVVIEKISDKEHMARSEFVRATAVGDTPEEAVENLKEAIDALIEEFGIDLVFARELPPGLCPSRNSL